jgi:Zn-dependent peptidase ImmA (M78 family)
MAEKIKTLREFFSRFPNQGKEKHALRNFNFRMCKDGAKIPSVRDLAQELGFDVYPVDFPKTIRGKLVRDAFANNGFRIEVNKKDDVRTQRWTVLHEIVHYFLHQNDKLIFDDSYRTISSFYFDEEKETQESEANLFAEALIFGDGALAAAVGLYGQNIPVLAKYFGVSEPTIIRALRKL